MASIRCSFHYMKTKICGTHVSQAQLHQWFWNLSIHLNHPERWLKYRLVGSTPKGFWFSSHGANNLHFYWVLRWCWCYWAGDHSGDKYHWDTLKLLNGKNISLSSLMNLFSPLFTYSLNIYWMPIMCLVFGTKDGKHEDNKSTVLFLRSSQSVERDRHINDHLLLSAVIEVYT